MSGLHCFRRRKNKYMLCSTHYITSTTSWPSSSHLHHTVLSIPWCHLHTITNPTSLAQQLAHCLASTSHQLAPAVPLSVFTPSLNALYHPLLPQVMWRATPTFFLYRNQSIVAIKTAKSLLVINMLTLTSMIPLPPAMIMKPMSSSRNSLDIVEE